ncbi:myosin regulatory light chain 2, smooth muscle minor isoform isoform X1 [Opisthocomus hoazin]|uniref:myosin regulatory light chain 2, smooth muscle minor isoform isoform X1 n=1 Tax=Opisthocomus hoazin TaxID=30419 RepID=UPI003F52D950
MGFLYVRITLYMHVGFKSVELAGVVSNALCRRTEKDVTMEYPFMIQMLGTACHASDTKQVSLEPTANMSSKRAKTKTTKKRPQRATSNVFAMFDQSQIQEFKEAFNMIDQNRDGFIDKEDLHDMLASLGKNPTDEYLDAMMNEAPGPINFTMFLTMFGEKLNGTDPEDVIRNAFACFDEEATGFIQEDYLRELLTTMGDRFTDEEVDELYREAPIDKKGNFNYIEFTRILKHGAKDKDD